MINLHYKVRKFTIVYTLMTNKCNSSEERSTMYILLSVTQEQHYYIIIITKA